MILRSAHYETKENEVAVGDIVPVPGARLEDTLTSASPDLLREMIKGFAQRMMDAEVEAVCGAGYGEVSPERVNSRNGYRRRDWDTRAGTEAVAFRQANADARDRRFAGRLDRQVAKRFRGADRDQQFLLPVDMREWLPEDHVVWALLGVVDRLDISDLEARYALGGAGRQAYDPRMLLALLIYAYSDGIRSSRQIERLCRTDVAMRVITGM